MIASSLNSLIKLYEQWAPADSSSLKSRFIRGAVSVLGGDAYSSALRLLGNLIMTRLLFPEAFGMMLVVNLVLGALQMLSDVGIRGALITKQDEITQEYVNSAWTISVLRGVFLAVLGILMASPIATFYEEPQLFGLLILSSFAPLVQGFTSPYPILKEKQIHLFRVVLWKSATQTLALLSTIILLLIYPTVWVLAASGIITAAISAAFSFVIFHGTRPRLSWNRDAVSEIVRFGRWVFVASALTYLARNGNQLIVSKWLSTHLLGVFSIALALSKITENFVGNLSWSLLFPVYAELGAGDQKRFDQQRRRIKTFLSLFCLAPIGILSIFGEELVTLLYDDRYHQAGWMLEIMSAGAILHAVTASIENIPHAKGDSYVFMWIQFFKGASMLTCMLIGGWLGGVPGLIIGMSVATAAFYPFLSFYVSKYGVKDYDLDAVLVLSGVCVVGLGWYLTGIPEVVL